MAGVAYFSELIKPSLLFSSLWCIFSLLPKDHTFRNYSSSLQLVLCPVEAVKRLPVAQIAFPGSLELLRSKDSY